MKLMRFCTALLYLLITCGAFAQAYSLEVDGVRYWVEDGANYACAEAGENCVGDINIMRIITFEDDAGATYNVREIRTAAFFGCDGLTSVTIEDASFMIYIREGAFADCPVMHTIGLPSNVNIYPDIVDGSKAFKNIVCMAKTPPSVNSDAVRDLPNARLYVPDENVAQYTSVTQGFWSSFAGRVFPLSEYVPEGPVSPTMVRIAINGGHLVLPSLKAGDEIIFEAEPGLGVYLPGEDTPFKGETHTIVVPANAGEIVYSPMFITEAMSSVEDADIVVPQVAVKGNVVEILNAGDAEIVITAINGTQVYRGHKLSHCLTVGVYIVSVGDYNFKVAI